MSHNTESLTDTLAKQAEARFSASSAIEKEERAWIASVLPTFKEQCENAELTFHSLLKDGLLLCDLINKLAESQVVKSSTMNLPFKQMENISSYLSACERLGLSQTELFETSDLYQSKNLQLVLQHICALHQHVVKNGGSLKSVVEKSKSSATPGRKTPTKNLITPEERAKNTSSPSWTSKVVDRREESASPSNTNKQKAPSVASLAADIATKEEFKYNPEVEAAAQRWIERVLGMEPTGMTFFNFLKSGVILCKLVNIIQPYSVPTIYEGSLPYRQMENIGTYIMSCGQIGLRDVELFETADLFTERNLNNVVNHIHVLAHFLAKRTSPPWTGPLIDSVRDAKSLFSATLVEESSWDKISSTPSAPLTEEQRELLAWANSKLALEFPQVELRDLSGDVKSGVKLIQLLSAVCRGQSVGAYNANPSLIWHAMQNASAILSFVSSQTFEKVDGVRSVDIVTGNVTSIARLLFYLRAKFDLDYLFAQTLGQMSLAASTSDAPGEDEEDTMEVEIMEGEDVPDHLRPLMSREDLEYYDRLARERKEEEARLVLEEEEAMRQDLAQQETLRLEEARKAAAEQEAARRESERIEASRKAREQEEARVAAQRHADEEAKAKEAKLRAEAEAKAKAEQEAKERAEQAKHASEVAADAKAQAEAKAKSDQEAKEQAEQEAKARVEKAKHDSEVKAREEHAKAEAELRAKAELEVKARAEADLRAKAEAEARTKAEANARAQAEVKAKAEAEAKASREAQDAQEREAKEKAAAELAAKQKAEAKVETTNNQSAATKNEPLVVLTHPEPQKAIVVPVIEHADSPASEELVEDDVKISAEAIRPLVDTKTNDMAAARKAKAQAAKQAEKSSTQDEVGPRSGSSGSLDGSKPKREKKNKDGVSTGSSTPKLHDSNDSIESVGKSDSRGHSKRDKAGKKDKPVSRSPDTKRNPLDSSEESSDAQLMERSSSKDNVKPTDPTILGAGQVAPLVMPTTAVPDDSVSPTSASGNSSLLMRPRHTREASTPRRINVKRTATFGSNSVVVADQDKVLRAQQVVRKHVATECLTTEQSYLNSLKVLINQFLEPLKRSKVLTQDEYSSLFSNIETIASHHAKFEQLLKNRISVWDDSSLLADVFLRETGFMVDYGPYLENYNKATVALHYIRKKNQKFDQSIKSFEEELMKTSMQTLDSFLVMPVQRIPRYRLLLSDMRKYTPPSWQEYADLETAVTFVDNTLKDLNSKIDRDGAERIKKMLMIGSTIQGDFPLIKADRKFIREGILHLKKIKVGDNNNPAKKKLKEKLKGLKAYVFLFNDLVVLCDQLKHAKSDDKCQFNFVHAYSLTDALIMSEKERSDKNLDQIANFTLKHVDKKVRDVVIYLHTESDLLFLHASSPEEREAWQKSLQGSV